MRYGHKTLSSIALTGTAPSADTDGIDATGALAVSACVSAPTGVTIEGGQMEAYLYRPVSVNSNGHPATWRWMRHRALDFSPETGGRDASSGDFSIPVGVGRVTWVPAGLVMSTAAGYVDITLSVRRDV